MRLIYLDHAQVAVEHVPIIVVLGLDHPVPDAKRPAEPLDFRPAVAGIEGRLEHLVEIPGPQHGAVHRREHLDVGLGIEAEPLGNPLLDQPHDQVLDRLGLRGLDEIEVAAVLGDFRFGICPWLMA